MRGADSVFQEFGILTRDAHVPNQVDHIAVCAAVAVALELLVDAILPEDRKGWSVRGVTLHR